MWRRCGKYGFAVFHSTRDLLFSSADRPLLCSDRSTLLRGFEVSVPANSATALSRQPVLYYVAVFGFVIVLLRTVFAEKARERNVKHSPIKNQTCEPECSAKTSITVI